jgi:prevent-host-death family protein
MVRDISQAKAELSALIEEVQKGHEVILAKAGKPVAKLVPYRGRPARGRPAPWPERSGLLRILILSRKTWPKRSACRSPRVEAAPRHAPAALVAG